MKIGITQRVIYKNGNPTDVLDIGWDFFKNVGVSMSSNTEKNISELS